MVCGRRCSLFCLFMSTWAFLMLVVLGVCFSIHSLVLVGDLPLPGSFAGPDEFKELADEAYSKVAMRCYVTGIVYLLFVVISAIVFHRDNKRRKRLYKKRKQQR
ncbi:uncharacterized protein LOC110177731 [Drosophila serrata]|uniref:uncharacterized protein LOC110177731 n=1 Tax=Drosophila serrata TaxID=7274 RepID=UPI000A1D1B9E|nr:uncharacterized protein LOC110177731 [Drosophila serrata]KAH8356284.1 hypothetical protein KR200_007512 [Drosophila serrata]